MPLTGELSDLSLAELIEFFCNQRKTGRLDVLYPRGTASFRLLTGSVVHAEIGKLRGIEAVYYALTLGNAAFSFTSETDNVPQTINQPWTSVVLEGLRRMDEGIAPPNPFSEMAEKAALVVEQVVALQPQPVAVKSAPAAPPAKVAEKPKVEPLPMAKHEPVKSPQEAGPLISFP